MSSSQSLPPGYRSVQDFLLRCHNRKSVYPTEAPTDIKQQQHQQQKQQKKDNKKYRAQPCLSCIPQATESTKPKTNSRYYYEGSFKSSSIPSDLPKPDSISFHPI